MNNGNYDKLIRDLIPEIIESAGKKCVYETLSDKEYVEKLNEKILEKTNKFVKTGSVDALADIGEVMHAILAYKNVSLQEFQRVRLEKLEMQGGYEKRILLKKISDK